MYGDISVSLINEMIHGEYAVRRFSVRTLQSSDTDNINNIGPLKVTQFHYLVWKDFLAPDHPGGILKFIKRIREAYNPSVNYILVHCRFVSYFAFPYE